MTVDHAPDLAGSHVMSIMRSTEAADRQAREDRDEITAGWLESQIRANTRAAYERDIREFFTWCGRRGVDPIRARPRDLRGFRNHLQGGGAENTTVNRKLAAVSSWFSFGADEHEDLMPANPMSNVRRLPRPDESSTQALDHDELERLFDVADTAGTEAAAFVRMLFYSGARVSEICNATTRDMQEERGHRTLWVTRKGGGRLKLTVARPAAEAMDRHLDGRQGHLFLGRDGLPLTRYSASRRLHQLVRAAGIRKRITPHSLRHTAVTLALDSGQDIRQVQRMMGHKKIETTMRYDRSRVAVDQSPTHALAAALEPGYNDDRSET